MLPAGTTVKAVAAGGRHTLAVTRAGELLAWGYNFDGQLGDGTTTGRGTPVRVILPGGAKAVAVAAGSSHSLAVTTTGMVYAWGSNEYGQLGDGTTTDRHSPVAVKLPAGAKVIAVGACYNYSVALTSAGRVLAWGHNRSGQLGDGNRRNSDVPVRVKLPARVTVTAIAAGGYQGLALTSAGTVLAWGDGGNGQLGNGGTHSSDVPVLVKLPAGTKVTRIGAGSLFSLALTSSGRVLAWGYNAFGQLGDGTTRSRDIPVGVRLPARTRVIAISGGGGFGLALTAAGRILAWGHNVYGQLGDGTTRSSDIPVRVRIPPTLTVIALAVGPTTRHSLAIVHPR
jgi:alpha-tubulin suppressor-like RCC1 family protein